MLNPLAYFVTLPLAIAQTIFWASTYYLLPALLPVLESEAGWSRAQISLALTGALVVSAASSPFTGQLIDAGRGRWMMAACGIGSALLLFVFSVVESATGLLVIWLMIGVCMAATLYEPCFSILTRHLGVQARRSITHVTLIAGFASTVSFPVANYIAHTWDWQSAVRFFALIVLFVAVPMAWFSIGRLENLKPVARHDPTQHVAIRPEHRRIFWLLGLAFTLGGINQGMVVTHLLPMLGERGLAADTAVYAAMVIGPMQVVGRVILMSRQSSLSNTATAFVCFAGTGISAFFLYLAGANVVMIFFAVALQGAGWGIVSIVRPALTREMLGQARFGAISGRMGALFTLGIAMAPTIGAGLWQVAGYNGMLIAGVAVSALGAVLLWKADAIHQSIN